MIKFAAIITIAAGSLGACHGATSHPVGGIERHPLHTVVVGDYGHGQPTDTEMDQCETAGGMMVDSTWPAPAPTTGPITWWCAPYAA